MKKVFPVAYLGPDSRQHTQSLLFPSVCVCVERNRFSKAVPHSLEDDDKKDVFEALTSDTVYTGPTLLE